MTDKTLDGTDAPPAKEVDRKHLLEFLTAAGIEADRTLSLQITPHLITVDYAYGAREVFSIVTKPGAKA